MRIGWEFPDCQKIKAAGSFDQSDEVCCFPTARKVKGVSLDTKKITAVT